MDSHSTFGQQTFKVKLIAQRSIGYGMENYAPTAICTVSGFSICRPQYNALAPGCLAIVLRVASHVSFTSPVERSRPGFMGMYTISVAFSDILGM